MHTVQNNYSYTSSRVLMMPCCIWFSHTIAVLVAGHVHVHVCFGCVSAAIHKRTLCREITFGQHKRIRYDQSISNENIYRYVYKKREELKCTNRMDWIGLRIVCVCELNVLTRAHRAKYRNGKNNQCKQNEQRSRAIHLKFNYTEMGLLDGSRQRAHTVI